MKAAIHLKCKQYHITEVHISRKLAMFSLDALNNDSATENVFNLRSQ